MAGGAVARTLAWCSPRLLVVRQTAPPAAYAVTHTESARCCAQTVEETGDPDARSYLLQRAGRLPPQRTAASAVRSPDSGECGRKAWRRGRGETTNALCCVVCPSTGRTELLAEHPRSSSWPGRRLQVINCVCGNNIRNEFMLDCDQCHLWSHGKCLGVFLSRAWLTRPPTRPRGHRARPPGPVSSIRGLMCGPLAGHGLQVSTAATHRNPGFVTRAKSSGRSVGVGPCTSGAMCAG